PRLRERARVILVDMHAEATSEKSAMGWHLDGRVSAVFGTHTHVQTADESVLPGGTAYISDLGMTGAYDSVIGIEKDLALKKFLTGLPVRFAAAKRDPRLCGALLDIDETTGRARAIERIQIREER
ncbi:MAG TPA: YmdB family metallophosphoesterase, partial [Candidatus Polarisedimenticolia bacterium]|nr:YmdB family metallophosphoesterase [Candidatus Polarisedimenticolia bacterium]